MYLGGGEREGQYGRDGEHELENTLAWNCHHTASRKTRGQHSHANTRQAHGTSIPGSWWAAPQPLPGLAGIPLQCSSRSSRCPVPPGAAGPGLGPGAGAGRGWQQLAAASAAGLWLLPGLLLLLLLLMMPRRRRAEWGGGGCWRWCCCHGYPTRRRHRSEQQLPQHPDLLQPMAAKQPSGTAQGRHPRAPLHRERGSQEDGGHSLARFWGSRKTDGVMHPKCLHSALVGRELGALQRSNTSFQEREVSFFRGVLAFL